ncbi:MAG TPA: DUF3108 domain-containing protein [Thermoanaerobaculia bacterium]|nr:DUF3108 domain-containing protein [Thermoanaerobaculia bacterium]
MTRPSRLVPFILVAALLAPAAHLLSAEGPAVRPEEFRYSWRLRGILSWFAGLRFPVSGTGALKNSPAAGNRLESELVIRGKTRGDGQYVYRSEIDRDRATTLMTYHGYEWEGRRRSEQTRFDYADRTASTRKEREEGKVETKVRDIPAREMRDVLTGIHFLRRNAGTFDRSVTSEIYSDGSIYPVVFRRIGARTITFQGAELPATLFEITAAPGDQERWPGGVRVWLSPDERRVPYRIEIQRSLASLRLELESAH